MLRIDADQSEPRAIAAHAEGERTYRRAPANARDRSGEIDIVAAHEIRVRAWRKDRVVPEDGSVKEAVEVGRGRGATHRKPGKSSAASAAYVTMPTAVERLM